MVNLYIVIIKITSISNSKLASICDILSHAQRETKSTGFIICIAIKLNVNDIYLLTLLNTFKVTQFSLS